MVKRIDASRAEALPGVVKVFSHENSPMDRFCRARIHPGQDLAQHDETLFSEHVRFVGDRVAAVVATSRATAEAAAALVEIEYEELPPLLTVDEALASTDVLDPFHGGNVAYEHEIDKGERPDLEGAVIVSTSTTTPRVHHAALEPHVCIAQGHSTGGMTVWTTSQGVYAARTVIAELLRHGVPPRARHQGPDGRVVRRQDRVHHRAGTAPFSRTTRAGRSSSSSTARNA